MLRIGILLGSRLRKSATRGDIVDNTLNVLYKVLDFENGDLITVTDEPNSELTVQDWLEKGEWLAAAKRAGADKVFFIENNPVAVFAKCGSGHLEKEMTFNNIWCLGRPRLLFLASPGEISVLDLAQKPINLSHYKEANSKEQSQMETLATLVEIEKIASELQAFHRDQIESGRIFGDSRFGDVGDRADKALIRDLKAIRRELIGAGLSGKNVKYAHALIGRSIFIRYLEDRGILTQDYFFKIAGQRPEWVESLIKQSSPVGLDISEHKAIYPKVLNNKEFTYALFKTLARDFNGDMFPGVNEEEQIVTDKHLGLIQDLIYGDVGVQKQLFFYSYRFDIVPLDLISSIYEEFYDPSVTDDEKQKKARQDGAYYTPSVLAELTISRVLTIDELEKKPRVLDPACGSGIFLVEAFRRIVRFEWHKRQNSLEFNELKQILNEQITGIEINEEAARITAFSLYLALLHYLDPPAISEQINKGNKLPNLIVSQPNSENFYQCIWVGNAFDTDTLETNQPWVSRFGKGTADIIISNPPWGAPGNNVEDIIKTREKVMLEWCKTNKKMIGDKEPSQAFLWRSLDFLKEGGKAAVLTSAGVLLKRSPTTQTFREQWMDQVRMLEVFNFTHVRKLFFRGAISPFMLICFEKGKQENHPVIYWSAKQMVAVKEMEAVLLSKYDRHVLRDENLTSGELWKNYWFGRLADRNFITWLQQKSRLNAYIDRKNSGRGYQLYLKDKPADKLQCFNSLKKLESRYELPEFTPPPAQVYTFGAEGAYTGLRVIVNEGISEDSDPRGIIISQYSGTPFCFYRSLYGIKLTTQEEWCHKVLVGILWSSLIRYYFFMTSANWGLWHHKLLLDEILLLPVVMDIDNPSTLQLIKVVDELRNDQSRRMALEKELDEIVFDLYGLNEEQRDLVQDFCDVTLPFFYEPLKSIGTMPAIYKNDCAWIEKYVMIFAKRWNSYLDSEVEIRAEVHLGLHDNMIAIEFFPADKSDPWNLYPKDNSWKYILEQVRRAMLQPIGTSRIIMEGIVHIVSDNSIIVIKRNEKRFWTRSLAREDAEVTLYKRMANSYMDNGGLT